MYLKRLDRGDTVTVLYDGNDPGRVTADLGLWTWQSPVIFLSGFIFLGVLAPVILYAARKPA